MKDLPYTQETWLFGFWGCDDYFDPRHDLVEEMRHKHDDMSWEPDWVFDQLWQE